MFRPSPRLRTACAALLLATATGLVSAADALAATGSGVWQKHDINFRYVGFTSIFSCEGLADQLKLLLVSAGARPDARATPGACANGAGQPDRMASARLVYYTLLPAPESAASADAVPGQWRRVALSVDHPRELKEGDCELMEQFRDEIVRKTFTTRNLAARISCVPHQVAGTRFSLEFEALGAAPK
jgi:hypothetical protein